MHPRCSAFVKTEGQQKVSRAYAGIVQHEGDPPRTIDAVRRRLGKTGDWVRRPDLDPKIADDRLIRLRDGFGLSLGLLTLTGRERLRLWPTRVLGARGALTIAPLRAARHPRTLSGHRLGTRLTKGGCTNSAGFIRARRLGGRTRGHARGQRRSIQAEASRRSRCLPKPMPDHTRSARPRRRREIPIITHDCYLPTL